MDKLISLFPDQLVEALKLGISSAFPNPGIKWDNIVISGLGGSGIGGAIVQDYGLKKIDIPIFINRTYDLPKFVGSKSLVIICSYSGNTEETISAFNEAATRNCFVVCVTSGGLILDAAAKAHAPVLQLPTGMPPRSCLGYSMVSVLFALLYAGVISDEFIKEISRASDFLKEKQEEIKAEARRLADRALGKLVVIYAMNGMKSIATRWRQQFNENSKVLGWASAVPEMNHNELVGWRGDHSNLIVFFLSSCLDHPLLATRIQINRQVIEQTGAEVFELNAPTNDYWTQLFYFVHLGDWMSWYLAKANNVDAMEVKVLDILKETLARQNN